MTRRYKQTDVPILTFYFIKISVGNHHFWENYLPYTECQNLLILNDLCNQNNQKVLPEYILYYDRKPEFRIISNYCTPRI